MMIRIPPSPPKLLGDTRRIPFDQRILCMAAALRARRLYPRALGELVARELTAYADFGYYLGHDTLITRLAAEVLDDTPGPPEPGPTEVTSGCASSSPA